MAAAQVTPLRALMFTSELKTLSYKITTSSARFALLRNGQNPAVVFTQVYTAGYNGIVTVYDLDKILEYAIDGAFDSFSIQIDSVALGSSITVFRCHSNPGIPATEFLKDRFLTSCTGIRDTCPGRHELLNAYITDAEPVSAVCTYLSAGTLTSKIVQLSTASDFLQLDVSPAKFVSATDGRLVAYEIVSGRRKARFRVSQTLPAADPEVIFLNAFGVWETFHFTGKKETKADYSRSQAMMRCQLTPYVIEEKVSFKAQTGAVMKGVLPMVYDIGRSPQIHLLRSDGSAGELIVITDSDLKHSNLDDEISDVSITYCYADHSLTRIEMARAPRIFDNTFDDTYE